jgi:tetratricopeptide (TPR) repeat protein
MAMGLLVSGPVRADEALAAKTLKEQGRFWESKGRLDLAAPAWKLLLQIEPRNSEALAGIAQFELANNRPDAASAIIDELKKQPELNRDAIKQIENAVSQKSINTKQLDQARAAARAGKVDEAVGLYRQLLEGRSLTGPIALEYFQTMGGTTGGWAEARKGLERLNANEPGNHTVELAYAQHLTYRAATRREGIRLLTNLARNPRVGSSANNAWRQALIWLEASRSDTALFQAYLNVQPNDAAIRARVASLNRVSTPKLLDANSIALRDGYTALNGDDVDLAEKRFESLLQNSPKNSDVLGGLGVVRLKQERFTDAENLLSDALRISGNRKWAEALNTSRFWLAMQDGQAKVDEKRLDLAEEAFQRAQKLDSNSMLPQAALIQALMRFDKVEEAQSLLGAMKDSPQRREVSRELGKRKAATAIENKQFADAERLLMGQSGPLDAEEQELLAWAQYNQDKVVEAAKGFAGAYRLSSSKGAAIGLVSSYHKQKSYPMLLALIQQDTGPLRDLVPVAIQQKIAQGETRFEQDSEGRLAEIDPVIILTDNVLWPATLALLKEKNPKKAYDLLLPVEEKLIEIGEYSMLNVLGKAATEVGDQATALRVLRKAAEGTDDETFYFMWAQSLIHFGRDEEAEKIMLKQLEYLDVDGLTLLGWTQSRLGKSEQADERFAAAYAKQPSEDSAKAIIYSTLKSKKFPLILTALSEHPSGPLDSLVTPEVRTLIAAGEKNFGLDANARLIALKGNVSGSESGGLSLKLEPYIRKKSGDAGEGGLRQSGVAVTLGWHGQTQQATLEVDQENATDAIDLAKGQRWYATWGLEVAPRINLKIGAGRTLNGAALQPTTVGEVGLRYFGPESSAGLRLFRRGNSSSLLALSGTPDLVTGTSWGRVIESGMDLTAYHRDSRWEHLGALVVSRLEGQGMPNNRKIQLLGRSLRELESVPGLLLGTSITIARYDRSLAAFEPGHGGYFSPTRSTNIALYGRYETSFSTLSLKFTGALGWGSHLEATAAGNPLTGNSPGKYPANTTRGIGYLGRIEGLKPLGLSWDLGFSVQMEKGSDYSDQRARVFVQRRWPK